MSDLVFSQRGSNNVVLLENKADQQQLLQELHNWCETNRLEINANKSKVMHFRNAPKLRSNRRFHCGPKILETINEYLHLGLLLAEHLDYGTMAKQVSKSARRALGLLITKFKAAWGCHFLHSRNYLTAQ